MWFLTKVRCQGPPSRDVAYHRRGGSVLCMYKYFTGLSHAMFSLCTVSKELMVPE